MLELFTQFRVLYYIPPKPGKYLRRHIVPWNHILLFSGLKKIFSLQKSPEERKNICNNNRDQIAFKGRQIFQGSSMTKCATRKQDFVSLTNSVTTIRSLSVHSQKGRPSIQSPVCCAKVQDWIPSIPISYGDFSKERERNSLVSYDSLNSAKKVFQGHSEWLLWLLTCILFFTLLFRWTARHKCSAIKSFLSLKVQNNRPRVGQTWLPSGMAWHSTPTSKITYFLCY